MTDNEKDRLSKNDLFQIGINLLNRNNQIKNTNAIEYNKLTSYISCGMIFTFFRFESLFTGIPGWIRWFILLLPFILIGWNLYTLYCTPKFGPLPKPRLWYNLHNLKGGPDGETKTKKLHP